MDKDIMKVSVDNLAQKQYEFLKKHGEEILADVLYLFQNDQFKELKNMLKESPAGDEMGTDHHFIDFSYEVDERDGLDLLDLINLLEHLKKLDE